MRTAKADQTGRMPRLIWVFVGPTSFCWFCHAAHLECQAKIDQFAWLVRMIRVLQSTHMIMLVLSCSNSVICICILYVHVAERKRWAATWQNQQSECAPSKDSDQPGHPPSLIRVFAVYMKKAWVLSYPLSAQRRLIRLGGCPGWSESSLGAHSFCWFCHVVTY